MNWISYSVIFLVTAIVCIVVTLCCSTTIGGIIAAVASAASIVGVYISIREVVGVKTKTEAVKASVTEMRTEIRQFLSFSELNELSRLIDEIEAYSRDQKLDLTLVKCKELKKELCIMRGALPKENAENASFIRDLKKNIPLLGSDILALTNAVSGESVLDTKVLNKHLEGIKEMLNQEAGKQKSKKL